MADWFDQNGPAQAAAPPPAADWFSSNSPPAPASQTPSPGSSTAQRFANMGAGAVDALKGIPGGIITTLKNTWEPPPGTAYTGPQPDEAVLSKADQAEKEGRPGEALVRRVLAHLPFGSDLDNIAYGSQEDADRSIGSLGANALVGKFAPDAFQAGGKMVGAAVRAGGKDLATAGLKAAVGGGIVKLAGAIGLGGEIGGSLIATPLLKDAAKQAGRGVKAGYTAALDAAPQSLKDIAARLRVPTPLPLEEGAPAAPPPIPTPAEAAPAPSEPAAPAPAPGGSTPLSQLYNAAQGLVDRNGVARSAAGEQTLARPAPTPQTAPAAQPAPTSPAPAPAAWKAGSSAPAATPPPTVTTIPAAKPAIPAQAFEDAARTAKAAPMAQLLSDHGISAADAGRMTDDQWGQLAKAAGVNAPSKLSQAEALFQLKKLELTAKPSPALADALKKPGALAAAKAFADSQTHGAQ